MTKSKPGIRLDAPIRDLDGDQLVDLVPVAGAEAKKVPVTLARISAIALMQVYPDETNLDGEEKVRRFALAMKIQGGDGALSAEEVALLKERVARAYGTLVTGRAWQLLDKVA